VAKSTIVTRTCGRCRQSWRCFADDPFETCEGCRVPVKFVPRSEDDGTEYADKLVEDVKPGEAIKFRKK